MQDLIPLTVNYQDNINLFVSSSKDLIEGTIILITKSDIHIDFGTKRIIKVSKEIYIENLIKMYTILNTSYLLTKRSSNTQLLTKTCLKIWLKKKLSEGQSIKLKLNIIDSIKNIYTINFKESLEHIKYTKLFSELNTIKKSDKSIKGFITNSIKGGFSVAIGGLIAFLPTKELIKIPNKKLSESFVSSSMYFKIEKITVSNKNVVLRKA